MNGNILLSISLEEFKSDLAKLVKDEVTQALNKTNKTGEGNSEYLTRKEIAKKLRISLPTLNKLTKSEAIKGYRIGKRVLYKQEEVEKVLLQITSNKYKRKDLNK